MASVAPSIGSFVVNLAANYLLSRLTARDGPRLDNLEAAGGDYGVAMPRGAGEKVRLTGILMAQADIDEDRHKVKDHAALVGAVGGAVQGAMVAGPVGAVVGAVVGGLLGAAAPNQYYYTYSVPALALLLLDRTDDDPIEGVDELWSLGKRIFKASESAVVSETLDGDGKLIKRVYGKNKYMKGLTVYGGHTDQDVDPVLAGQQEISETSGYVFRAYVMLDDLQLAYSGNSVAAIEALTLVKAGQTVADVVERWCAAANIDPLRNISTTALTDRMLRGCVIDHESTVWDAIKPLLPVFAIDAGEVSGQVRFYKRAQTMRATITAGEMGAHVYGDEPPERFLFKRETDLALPRETSLTFIDPDRNYQPNSATSRRSEGSAASNVSVSLQLVLSANEGASAAALMHWDAWLGRTAVSFALTDAWNSLAVGLAYGLPFAGQVLPYRITRRTRGANGIIEVEALSDESVTYTASVAGSSGTVPDGGSTLFPDTRLILLDMPITEDAHDDYGFYIVMGASAGGWTRGRIEVSGDAGASYATVIDSDLDCPAMGDVTGTLAAGSTSGLDDTLDTTSVLTVVLLNDLMVLESASDAELDAWDNFAFVGKDGLGEYLQFKTATKVGTAAWELTNLRRGRKGTDWAIGTHVSGEEFALLGQGGVFRMVFGDTSGWGDPLKFRGVTLHQDEADAAIINFANTGEGKRPYSPVNVEGTWDGSNNLTITFDARSRLNAGGLGIDDNFEFEVEILTGAGRTITVTAESAAYSAADQTIDGITPGDSIAGRVRQTSDVNDGRWRDFALVGPLDAIQLEDGATPFHMEDGTAFVGLE